MIYYKEEKKKLVIPSGFVMIPIDCDEAIEQAREQGYQEGFADGSSATCDTEEGTYSLTDDFDGEETVFPSEGKTGFNKIVIVDDGYGDAKYDEGYADGIADCSGSTPCDCSSAITEAYQSGYTEGYNQGQADCPECSGGTCNLQQKVFVVTDPAMENVFPDAGYDGLSQVMLLTSTLWDSAHTNGYNEGYQSGYTAGQADCDCTESYEIGYQDGYADGRESIASGCPMQEKFIRVSTIEESVTPDYGYAGLSEVHISAENFYNTAYNDGYAAGLEDCSGSTPCDCSSAVTEAYQSGYTEGWDDGFMSGAGVELVDYVHSTNMGNNVEEYLVTNIIPTKYTKAKFAGQYKQYTTYGVLVGFNDSGDSQDWRLFVFENGAPITYGALETMFDVGLTRTEMGAGTYSVNDDLWFEWGYESGSTIMRSPQISRTFTMVDREPAQGDIKINMGIMWVSSVQIWDNGTLVFNGKAAKRNNDYGLWDSVSKTFLTDANLNLVGETNLNNN